MEAVGIGDLHLTDAFGSGGLAKYIPDHDQMVFRQVKRVLDWAAKKGIRHAFFYGDLCHNPRMSYEAMTAMSNIVAYARKLGIEVHIILGNHDLLGRTAKTGHSLQCFQEYAVAKAEGVNIYLNGCDTEIDGAPVRFLSFPRAKFSSRALNVCHLDVQGAVADSGQVIKHKDRDASANVIVAGHIHTNQRVRNTFYSGTLYQTCFGERAKKFFHHISFTSTSDYEITSVPFKPEYVLHSVTVESKKDLPRDLSDKDLVKLVIKDGAKVLPPDYQHLNVVAIKNFQSREQLHTILTEDLPQEETKISVKDFFNVWIDGLDCSDDLRQSVIATRRRILSSVR